MAPLILLLSVLAQGPPPWAHNVKTTVTKSADSEDVVVEVDGVKAGRRQDTSGVYDLVWERDPLALGLKHRLHPHKITKVFPAESDPVVVPGSPIDVPADVVADTTPRVIDINYFYTAQVAAAQGGEANMPAFAALTCALSNTAYANSGLGHITFRCLGPFKVAYPDTTNLNDAYTWLSLSGSGAAEVAAKYALTGADVTHMVINVGGGNCGLGTLTASASSAISTSERSCTNSNLSGPHEVGHNMGFHHDVANAQCPALITSPVSGQQCCANSTTATTCNGTYNYGHAFPVGAPQWRTIMAYPGAGGSRITQISNPAVLYQGQWPTGIPNERDNARVAVARAPIVSAFRTAVVTTHKPPSTPTAVLVTP